MEIIPYKLGEWKKDSKGDLYEIFCRNKIYRIRILENIGITWIDVDKPWHRFVNTDKRIALMRLHEVIMDETKFQDVIEGWYN